MGSLNLVAGGNPVNGSDPSGMCSWYNTFCDAGSLFSGGSPPLYLHCGPIKKSNHTPVMGTLPPSLAEESSHHRVFLFGTSGSLEVTIPAKYLEIQAKNFSYYEVNFFITVKNALPQNQSINDVFPGQIVTFQPGFRSNSSYETAYTYSINAGINENSIDPSIIAGAPDYGAGFMLVLWWYGPSFPELYVKVVFVPYLLLKF